MILTREQEEGGIHCLITTREGSCVPLIAFHAQIQSIRSINGSMIQNTNPIMRVFVMLTTNKLPKFVTEEIDKDWRKKAIQLTKHARNRLAWK